MKDYQKFNNMKEMQEFLQGISPEAADYKWGRITRYEDGYRHFEFCFIEDKKLIPIYKNKERSASRISEAVVCMLFSLLFFFSWFLRNVSANPTPRDLALCNIFAYLSVIMFIAGVIEIVYAVKFRRMFKSMLEAYNQTNNI